MKDNVIVMHMSGAYISQNFYDEDAVELDCRRIEGTNCYLDEAAKEILRDLLRPFSYEGIHFLDSGNYHYLSLLWLEKIQEPFSLAVFDHHPDMQCPAFGGITSCGGWVLEALKTLPFLKKVYLLGTDEKLFCEVTNNMASIPLPKESSSLCIQLGMEGLSKDRNPIYLSFDKDVLGLEDCLCDWDQGEMTWREAEGLLNAIVADHRVLGMDVCGEDSQWMNPGGLKGREAHRPVEVNQRTNKALLDWWKSIIQSV